MNHSFNVAIATEYGMLEAVLMEHLYFWVAKNEANNANFHDGYYWTYNSIKALSELFPYVSKNTISRALHHLAKEGLIIVGNFNKSAYDRTTWYALTEKGMLLLRGSNDSQSKKNTDSKMDDTKMSDCVPQNSESHFPKWEMEEPKTENGKVWHSNSKYRKVIWQCNHKFDGEQKCSTPHLYEETIKELFIGAVNVLLNEKDEIIENFNSIKDTLFDIKPLETERSQLQQELNIVVELIQQCINENARIALDQTEYQKRYDELAN